MNTLSQYLCDKGRIPKQTSEKAANGWCVGLFDGLSQVRTCQQHPRRLWVNVEKVRLCSTFRCARFAREPAEVDRRFAGTTRRIDNININTFKRTI